jgi:hypothetical protein
LEGASLPVGSSGKGKKDNVSGKRTQEGKRTQGGKRTQEGNTVKPKHKNCQEPKKTLAANKPQWRA